MPAAIRNRVGAEMGPGGAAAPAGRERVWPIAVNETSHGTSIFGRSAWAKDGFWPLMIVIMSAPASVHTSSTWLWSAQCMLVGIVFVWWAIWSAAAEAPVTAPWREHGMTTLLACGVIGWVGFQTIPGVAPDWQHPLWGVAGTILGVQVPSSITLDPGATSDALVRMMAYFGVFWLVMQFSHDPARGRTLLWFLTVTGVIWVIATLCVNAAETFFTSASAPKNEPQNPFMATDALRTLGLYLGLSLISALALLLWPVKSDPRRHRRQVAGLIGALILFCAAIAFGKNFSNYLFAILGIGTLSVLRLRSSGWNLGISLSLVLVITVAMLVGIVVGGWVTGSELLGAGAAKLQLATRVMGAIGETSKTGYGIGVIGEGLPFYKDGHLIWISRGQGGTVSGYLSLALGAGVVAAALFLGIFGWLIVAFTRCVRSGRQEIVCPAVALAATVLMASNALIDSTAQSPVLGFTYAAILGAGFARSWRPPIAKQARR